MRSQSDTIQLKVRMKEPLRAKLESAAEMSGVTMNAEIVDRIERTFLEDGVYGGPVLSSMFKMMAAAADMVSARLGSHPATDYDAWIAVQDAWKGIMDSCRPAPSDKWRQWCQISEEDRASWEPEGYSPPPEPPEPPKTTLMGGLLSPNTVIKPEDQAEYDKTILEYNHKLSEWQAANADRQRHHEEMRAKMKPWFDRSDELTAIGQQVALKFPAPASRK